MGEHGERSLIVPVEQLEIRERPERIFLQRNRGSPLDRRFFCHVDKGLNEALPDEGAAWE